MAVRYSRFLPVATFISDLLVLNIALQCAHELVYTFYSNQIQSANFLLLVNLLWIALSSITKSYVIKRPLVLSDNLNKFLSSVLYHLLLVLAVIYFFKVSEISRWELIFTYFLFFFLIIIERSGIFFILDYIRKNGYNKREVLIIGDENIADKLVTSFSKHPEYGYDLTDFISEEIIKDLPEQNLIDKLLSKNPDEIFVCYKHADPGFVNRLINIGEEYSIKIKIVSDLILNNNYAQIVNYDTLPVIHISSSPELSLKILVFKRCFDIIFSFSAIAIGSPIFVLLMALNKVTSKGPVFYRQERIGKNKRPFYIYKFRTMHVNAEHAGPQLSCDNDPRITRTGKIMRQTRLDELPQFWNVLKGDMSIVGPRPERQYFIEQLIEKSPNYKKLLRIKPGITSIGQVTYGYAENVEQMRNRVRYDLIYLNNINFNSDMAIILKTIRVMVQCKGK